MWEKLIPASILAYLVWSIVCLGQNIIVARRMRVPIIWIPIDFNNILWMIIQSHFWSALDRLPIKPSSIPSCIRLTRRGWYFFEKSATHVHLGPVWALVSPASITLHFADPDAINNIFSRRQDFVRPIKEYKLLEVYGPCISTAGWDDWSRHRKVLAAPFNEKVMKFVWEESQRQTKQMLYSWISSAASEDGIPSVQRDTRNLSLNVLAAIGFRKSYDFHGSADAIKTIDEADSYRNSLQTVLDNAIPLMLIPYRFLISQSPLIPEKIAKIGNAATSFKSYMVKMVEEERLALEQGEKGSGGIMGYFIHALDVHNQESPDIKTSKDGKKGLSLEEIFGNLFVINFAGHDTTANTLGFCLLLLAAHPEIQAWVSKEVNYVLEQKGIATKEWDYEAIYPKLKRCQAVFRETLRLYPPIMALPKWTSANPQTISVDSRIINIPPYVGTVLSLLAIQTHPDYWEDPLSWKPSRWIQTSDDGHEILTTPVKGTYFPWSDGPQNCPGKKFSEVEGAVVLATLLQNHRLRAVKESGESDEAVRERVLACVNNTNMEMLLRMKDPDAVKVVCEKV